MQEEKYGNFKMQDEMAVRTGKALSGTTAPNPLFGQVFPYAYTSESRFSLLHYYTIPAVRLLPIEEYLPGEDFFQRTPISSSIMLPSQKFKRKHFRNAGLNSGYQKGS
ncbi:MAG: hypothetical protein P8184_14615 [Calditrichia bacterium]